MVRNDVILISQIDAILAYSFDVPGIGTEQRPVCSLMQYKLSVHTYVTTWGLLGRNP